MSEYRDSLETEKVYEVTIPLIFSAEFNRNTQTMTFKFKVKCLVYENGKECGKVFDNIHEFLHHIKYEHGLEY